MKYEERTRERRREWPPVIIMGVTYSDMWNGAISNNGLLYDDGRPAVCAGCGWSLVGVYRRADHAHVDVCRFTSVGTPPCAAFPLALVPVCALQYS